MNKVYILLLIIFIFYYINNGLIEYYSNNNIITDFCEIYKIKYNDTIRYPNNIKELRSIIKYCIKKNLNIRIRGGGHSCSGISIPKSNEIMINLENFNKYNFNDIDTITVESGIDITYLNNYLKTFGYFLPIIPGGINLNDIYNPTVGGFISAGGISKNSVIFGGFWENVIEIQIMDGLGNIINYNNTDEIFPWLFSNYGLLGIIISAKLKIIKYNNKINYPLNKTGHIKKPHILTNENYIFYHILCNPKYNNKINKAKKYIKNIFKKYYNHNINKFHIETYTVDYINFNPPLLYPNEKFTFILFVQEINKRDNIYKKNIKKINNDITNFIEKNPTIYYRYPQVEYYNMNNIERYYKNRNIDIFNKLLEYKKKLDPKNIINKLTF